MTKISKACEILKSGGVIGLPTETVYGLAGSIQSNEGIDKIFQTKERPFFDPLIVHVSSIEQAKTCVKSWPKVCDVLAESFWPGPLTFILPKSTLISDKISSGLDTVGIRMPNHDMALELIEQLGHPVAAPSANKFKKTSPTNFNHVQSEFPETFILDGGQCEIGIESTIIGITQSSVLIYRPGMVSREQLQEELNKNHLKMKVQYQESPVAPGHLKHHYMPKKPIILEVLNEIVKDSQHIPKKFIEDHSTWTLPDNAATAARELYGKFRSLDDEETSSIKIKLNDDQLKSDLFKGVINRLIKAASYTLPKELSNKS